ncbi:MAG: hypothetical protein WD690_10250 [Vicinamibacterales bacterium]
MSVAITKGAVFQPGAPRNLFAVAGTPGLVNGLFYHVMPDGRRFVMPKEAPRPAASATVAPHIIAVLDWTSELRRK